MATSNNPGKKIIKTTPRVPDKLSIGARKGTEASSQPLLYGRKHYILMGIGFALIGLGLLLMSGGEMPSPDVLDASHIYSFRRTVLAPVVMLAGIALEVVAIFKR